MHKMFFYPSFLWLKLYNLFKFWSFTVGSLHKKNVFRMKWAQVNI